MGRLRDPEYVSMLSMLYLFRGVEREGSFS